MSTRKNEKGFSLNFLSRGSTPPLFRPAKSSKSCQNCTYFYLKIGWKGLGDCTLFKHITDETLVCDSHTPEDEQ